MAQRQRQEPVARNRKRKQTLEVDADSMVNLLMAGRASERMDLLEFIERVKAAIPPALRSVQIGLRHVEDWARERDQRLHGKG